MTSQVPHVLTLTAFAIGRTKVKLYMYQKKLTLLLCGDKDIELYKREFLPITEHLISSPTRHPLVCFFNLLSSLNAFNLVTELHVIDIVTVLIYLLKTCLMRQM